MNYQGERYYLRLDEEVIKVFREREPGWFGRNRDCFIGVISNQGIFYQMNAAVIGHSYIRGENCPINEVIIYNRLALISNNPAGSLEGRVYRHSIFQSRIVFDYDKIKEILS